MEEGSAAVVVHPRDQGWGGGCGGGEADAACSGRRREGEATREPTPRFKSIYFRWPLSWPPKIRLFSAVEDRAAENTVIFGGLCQSPKINPYFWRPGFIRQKKPALKNISGQLVLFGIDMITKIMGWGARA
jgi:hypothetical protein